MYDKLLYNKSVKIAISVRLDDEAQRALAQLEASGLTRSEAIRTALVKSAQQERRRDALRQEMAALEADEDDRREMLEIAEYMELLRAQG
jgi:antitoxin component of RelBE/YafQ-DinJ toxin-antitoxin module